MAAESSSAQTEPSPQSFGEMADVLAHSNSIIVAQVEKLQKYNDFNLECNALESAMRANADVIMTMRNWEGRRKAKPLRGGTESKQQPAGNPDG